MEFTKENLKLIAAALKFMTFAVDMDKKFQEQCAELPTMFQFPIFSQDREVLDFPENLLPD